MRVRSRFAGLLLAGLLTPLLALASSHREAPAIALDPAADNTDLWAWVKPGTHDKLYIVAAYNPLEEPSGGPELPQVLRRRALRDPHRARRHEPRRRRHLPDPFRTEPLTRVDVADLSKGPGGGKEFFAQLSGSVRLPKQTYTRDQGRRAVKSHRHRPGRPGRAGQHRPAHLRHAQGPGAASTPQPRTTTPSPPSSCVPWAAAARRARCSPARATTASTSTSAASSTSPTSARRATAQDGVAGYNCHAIALEIPTTKLTADGQAPTARARATTTLGVWASASRRKVAHPRARAAAPSRFGPWVQVSRLGLPLDQRGGDRPPGQGQVQPHDSRANDVANFGAYFLNPVIVRDAEAVGIYAALGVDPTPVQVESHRHPRHHRAEAERIPGDRDRRRAPGGPDRRLGLPQRPRHLRRDRTTRTTSPTSSSPSCSPRRRAESATGSTTTTRSTSTARRGWRSPGRGSTRATASPLPETDRPMRLLHAAMLAPLLVLGAACRSSSSPASAPTLAEARALALAAPAGDAPVDREIARLQDKLRRLPTPDDWVLLGQTWVQKSRRAGDAGLILAAEGAATAALAMAPGHRAALGLRALVLLDQHRFSAARTQARAILSREPQDLLALAVLSDAALEMGDVPEAMQAAQTLVDLKPGLAAYGRAAHLRWTTGDVSGAKLLYARAIEAGRGARDAEPVAWMMVQAALVFWNEGDLDGALAGASQALTLVPGYAAGAGRRGPLPAARSATGARRSACWSERTEARPSLETRWLLADARREAGEVAAAERLEARMVREGRQSDPLVLGLFLATRGRDLGEAVRVLEAEHRARPGVAVEDAYAWALHRAGRLAEARAAIDRATAHGTPDPRLLYHAGAIRLAEGRTEEGRAPDPEGAGAQSPLRPGGRRGGARLAGRPGRGLAAPSGRSASRTHPRRRPGGGRRRGTPRRSRQLAPSGLRRTQVPSRQTARGSQAPTDAGLSPPGRGDPQYIAPPAQCASAPHCAAKVQASPRAAAATQVRRTQAPEHSGCPRPSWRR